MKIEFTIEQVNEILNKLGTFPYNQVSSTIHMIAMIAQVANGQTPISPQRIPKGKDLEKELKK